MEEWKSVGVQRRGRIELVPVQTSTREKPVVEAMSRMGLTRYNTKLLLWHLGNLERREIAEGRCRLANNRLRWREGVDRNGGSCLFEPQLTVVEYQFDGRMVEEEECN